MTADTVTSIKAFAERLGVQRRQILKAIASGRLERSVGRNAKGQPVIVDVDLAMREFQANRDPSKDRNRVHGTIAEAKNRLIRAQARKVELANKEKTGRLVPAKAVEIRYSTRVVTVRDRLLAIPSRIRLRLPHLTDSDLIVLDEVIREALEELAAHGDSVS